MKKTLALLLATVLAAGMCVTGFAANDKITEQAAAIADVEAGDRLPGYEIWLPLKAEYFAPSTLQDPITMTDVKNSKITVKPTYQSGEKAVSMVAIKADSSKDKVANIVITLADPFPSIERLAFEVKLQLSIDGKRQDYETYVSGVLANNEEEVDSGTEYVDFSNSDVVAVCTGNAKNVEAVLGDNLSVFVDMQKGKKYYGSLYVGATERDDATLAEYPDIEEVYYLTTIGLNAEGKNVKFNTGSEYYVYNKDLAYLGKTGDMLPYSTKYYLSSKKLDVSSQSEPEEDSEPEPGNSGEPDLLPAVGNQGGASGNGTNPDTGADPLFGVAIITAALALVAAVAASVRKKKQ